MKTRYFKDNESYFKFINKNRNKKLKYFLCSFTTNSIKIVYQFD